MGISPSAGSVTQAVNGTWPPTVRSHLATVHVDIPNGHGELQTVMVNVIRERALLQLKVLPHGCKCELVKTIDSLEASMAVRVQALLGMKR